jgi:hypothetical protein
MLPVLFREIENPLCQLIVAGFFERVDTLHYCERDYHARVRLALQYFIGGCLRETISCNRGITTSKFEAVYF